MHLYRPFALATLLVGLLTPCAQGHPVAKNTHDRTVVVRLVRASEPDRVTVRVAYRLEVDEWTVIERDMEPYREEIDLFAYRNRPLEFYGEFARHYAPALADRLVARVDGRRLEFRPVSHVPRLHDEEGKALGHLRCDFVFETTFPAEPGHAHELLFREQCYLGEEGVLDLSLVADASVPLESRTEPDEAVKQRAKLERQPGDDAKLREVRATFTTDAAPQAVEGEPTTPTPPREVERGHDDEYSLLRLFLHTDYGFWLTMLMALVFGAAHALTPGHGKTLVAAYLVGERGTVWHAVVLGLVTTLTHTGMVLGIAAVLFFLPADARDSFGRVLQSGLGLVMGLLVTCMGFWLLLQRLAGRADHFHVGGAHHHHHGEAPAAPAAPERGPIRWWGLVVLGITGGLVPCWDAIYLLLYTVGRSQFLIALPAVLAFSAGLAGVLVLIGVLVVQIPHFARSRWGAGRVVRALPIVSAVVVTLMGVWLCYEGVHGR